jgi:hypothetical protein
MGRNRFKIVSVHLELMAILKDNAGLVGVYQVNLSKFLQSSTEPSEKW